MTPNGSRTGAVFENFPKGKKFSKIDASPVLYDGPERSEGPSCSTGASPATVVQDAERSEVSWTTDQYIRW